MVGTFLGLLLSLTAHAQRLPDTVIPQHYNLTLTPNLQAATFTGDETIDVNLTAPATAITLNAAEIQFDKVTTEVAGKTLLAQIALDPDRQQATFNFGQTLPAGPLSLKIVYRGILNNELRGFYLSRTAKRNYAVTQFEPTDARRAFPSFDEPSFKATFAVKLVIAKGDTAISNTNVVSDTPGPRPDEHTVSFATSPKMSTYLVAFLVGDFECISGQSDGVPIRACATPDKVQYGKFALETAEFVLHYYDNYFGIKYPMPKLDMIGLPDFEAGAMENFGAITYRETDMLIDEKTASVDAKKNVSLVVAHEMAHQWFGDMVTMRWWDNIWLNEGFATWMENKPIAAWKPEWNIAQDVASQLNGTLNLDAQKVTRTIRAKADTPAEINEMFDGITYGKAAAVLLMVENYLGEETFRRGVHSYLAAHIYGNASAEDFWSVQTQTSQKPVDRIMESLVEQPGEPLLSFAQPHDGSVAVTQRRFFLSPTDKPSGNESWTLPVCFKAGADGQACEVLSAQQQTLKAPASPLFFANAGGKGYYRYAYTPDTYNAVVSKVESALSPEERISLLGNEWAGVRAGQAPIGDFLQLAAGVKQDSSADVIANVAGAVNTIDDRIASTQSEHEELAAWVRKNFAPALAKLGAIDPQQQTPEQKELRATLFALLGGVGDDPTVIAESRRLATQYLANPASVENTVAETAVDVAAEHGDAGFYDQLLKVSETANNPQVRSLALNGLALFRDPVLVRRTLDYAASGKVKNQDAVYLFTRELRNRHTRDIAWSYVQANWERVQAQMTKWGGAALVASTGSFCDPNQRSQVTSFFSEHKVEASDRALQQATDSINACSELRAAQGPRLRQWLTTSGSSAGQP